MTPKETLQLNLHSLPEGHSQAVWTLTDDWLHTLPANELKKVQLHTTAEILRVGSHFQVDIHTEGTVTLPCDLCLEDMEQPVDARDTVTALLGDIAPDNEDTVTVSEQQGTLDLTWQVFQSVCLSLPIRHVHAPGKCDGAMTRLLQELSTARSGDEQQEDHQDHRWDALKGLSISE